MASPTPQWFQVRLQFWLWLWLSRSCLGLGSDFLSPLNEVSAPWYREATSEVYDGTFLANEWMIEFCFWAGLVGIFMCCVCTWTLGLHYVSAALNGIKDASFFLCPFASAVFFFFAGLVLFFAPPTLYITIWLVVGLPLLVLIFRSCFSLVSRRLSSLVDRVVKSAPENKGEAASLKEHDLVPKNREDNIRRQEGQEKATADHADNSQKPHQILLGRRESSDFKPSPDAFSPSRGKKQQDQPLSHEQASDSNHFVSSDRKSIQYGASGWSRWDKGADSEHMSGDAQPLPDASPPYKENKQQDQPSSLEQALDSKPLVSSDRRHMGYASEEPSQLNKGTHSEAEIEHHSEETLTVGVSVATLATGPVPTQDVYKIDPEDGKEYCFPDVLERYRGLYPENEIREYWEHTCHAIEAPVVRSDSHFSENFSV